MQRQLNRPGPSDRRAAVAAIEVEMRYCETVNSIRISYKLLSHCS